MACEREERDGFSIVAPARPLRRLISGYWIIRDVKGSYRGKPITTSPHAGAILTVNIGRPNVMLGRSSAPKVSLLGVQTVARAWRSAEDTYFAMAMLTCLGVVRLLPHHGNDLANQLVDVGALTGDRWRSALSDDLTARSDDAAVAAALDKCFLTRLDRGSGIAQLSKFDEALRRLERGSQVQAVASALGVSRRQLSRWFSNHLGVGPNALADIRRFQRSLHAVQFRGGDACEGYCDQAHQIRDWRRRIDSTPNRYTRTGLSPMASFFQSASADVPAFYL